MNGAGLPLFPLSAVLFPGGTLQLQIFERRYLDMVRHCSRSGTGFGVCLILSGGEAGVSSVPAAIGTLAKIVDFYTLKNGLLGLRVQGDARFHVQAMRVRDNGLIHSQASFFPDEPTVRVPPELGLLTTLLDRLLERVGGRFSNAPRVQFDDASWVGFRLAELLPLQLPERQYLLQMVDPLQRLRQLLQYLPRFQHA